MKKLIFIILIPLGALGAVSDTDISGSDFESPHGTPFASRRVSKQPEPRSPGERRERAVSDAILRLKVTDEDNSIHQNFSAIPEPLLEKFTGAVSLFAGNLRRLTTRRYDAALESLVSELSAVFLRFQERPKILESIVHETAAQFSQTLDLKITGAPSSRKVSRKVKQEIISTEFFPTLLVGVTRSVLERDQTISGITADDWAGVFSTAYEETSRARVLEVSGTVGVEDRSWYEHMTAFTPNPDFELFELLGKCSDRSRPWIRRMVKLYSSDRMPLNSLKMTKYFLRIPETYEAYVAKVFETFFDEEFEKRKDSQARIVHIFMKKPIGPGTYIPHFVNIIGFLEKKLNVELAEIFVQNLTTTGWGYVEAQIRESKGHGHPFELTSSQLNCLFQQGLQEAQPVSDV